MTTDKEKPKKRTKKGEDKERAQYVDEPLLRITYFHPKCEKQGAMGLICQICNEQKQHGFVIDMNITLEDTGEEYIDTFVICEDCFESYASAPINSLVRNICEMVQYESNL
jgi:hypothetical protein